MAKMQVRDLCFCFDNFMLAFHVSFFVSVLLLYSSILLAAFKLPECHRMAKYRESAWNICRAKYMPRRAYLKLPQRHQLSCLHKLTLAQTKKWRSMINHIYHFVQCARVYVCLQCMTLYAHDTLSSCTGRKCIRYACNRCGNRLSLKT